MNRLESAWYTQARWPLLLTPVEWLYKHLAARDRQKKQKKQWCAPVPVLVVGNITVGGTGKSPLVSALVHFLRAQGWTPGIISRGYGGQSETYPMRVDGDSDPVIAGDEPVMLAGQTGAPVVVDPDRARAARCLLQHTACDLIISDDGLQHLSLGRDMEIVVIDGQRGLGNGHCLPVGPLREPADRLHQVDYIMLNGAPSNGNAGQKFQRTAGLPEMLMTTPMRLVPLHWRQPSTGNTFSISAPPFGRVVRAVAGIGHPERFFNTLKQLGLEVSGQGYPDHHPFKPEEIHTEGDPVLMTAKDAVKCAPWLTDNHWVLDVSAEPDPVIMSDIHAKLLTIQKEKSNG